MVQEETKLTPETIVEMIEVSFVNGCLQLSQGYVDVLKLLIVAVKAAYEYGLSIPDLMERLSSWPVRSANRDLMKEEIALRSAWINIIYMTLAALGEKHGGSKDDVRRVTMDLDARTERLYVNYVDHVADWRRRQDFSNMDGAAVTKESLRVDDLLKACDDLVMDDEDDIDPVERAMLPQNLRVVVLTLTVLEEERRCSDDASIKKEAAMPPRPPIPGT